MNFFVKRLFVLKTGTSMLLIADSGSTKCDWMLMRENKEAPSFSTMGFNPYFHNEAVISNAIRQNNELSGGRP